MNLRQTLNNATVRRAIKLPARSRTQAKAKRNGSEMVKDEGRVKHASSRGGSEGSCSRGDVYKLRLLGACRRASAVAEGPKGQFRRLG